MGQCLFELAVDAEAFQRRVLPDAATRALANRWTQGYMDHAPSWARLLTTAIAERRFQRLRDLFDADSRG
ncbi:hypothetical protein ACFU8Q_40725, partial [Streptomyces sp. NPDC057543]|uniref:hypothetical protein n=1 Tax=Streptomyces sp. NPDC057543 TaxID=3346163 RepID=UPI0036C79BFA